MKKAVSKEENKTSLNWIDDKFAVDRVNNYSDTCTFFNLYIKTAIGNVAIYGCKIVSNENGDFIAMPSRKNPNSNEFYPECSIRFDDGIKESIIKEVGTRI